MSDATTVSRNLIVLPGATWKAELTAELVRIGVAEDRAPISAGRVLSRIVRHAGYLNCFQYDDAELEPPKEKPDKRSDRARSHRNSPATPGKEST